MSEKIEVTLYYAPWCGHCKHLVTAPGKQLDNNKPQPQEGSQWMEIKKSLEKKDISVKHYNDQENKDVLEKKGNKIRGFPTILIEFDEKEVEYNGAKNSESILEFITNKCKDITQSGGSKENMYKKYMKYKTKYLKLKNNLSSN